MNNSTGNGAGKGRASNGVATRFKPGNRAACGRRGRGENPSRLLRDMYGVYLGSGGRQTPGRRALAKLLAEHPALFLTKMVRLELAALQTRSKLAEVPGP